MKGLDEFLAENIVCCDDKDRCNNCERRMKISRAYDMNEYNPYTLEEGK